MMQSNSFLTKHLPASNQAFSRLHEPKSTKPLQCQEGSSLQNIHLKLQEEAEKIVRWKVSTEISLNQKERELNEASKVIQMLRNHLVEEQLNFESLSHSLLKEKNQREQIEEHAQRKRLLCNALKQRHEELEQSVKEFHEIRECLQGLYAGQKNQINTLTENFQRLSARHEEVINNITSKAGSEIKILMEDGQCLRDNLSLTETKLESLTEELEFNQLIRQEFGQKMFGLEEMVEHLTAKYHWTSKEFEKIKKTCIASSKDFEERIKLLEDINSDLSNKLMVTSEKLNESRCEFEEAAERVKYLTECNSALEGSKEELFQQVQAIDALKNELEKEAEFTSQKLDEVLDMSSKNEIILRNEIQIGEINLKRCRDELEEKIDENKGLYNELEQLQEKCSNLEREFQEKLGSSENNVLAKIEENKDLIEALTELQKKYELSISEKSAGLAELELCNKELSSLKEKSIANDDIVKTVEEENAVLKTDVQERTEQLNAVLDNEKKFQEERDSLSEAKEELQEEVKKLKIEFKELEKNVNTGKKNLNTELKKNEKLKSRIQSLELKLKEKCSSAKIEHGNFNKLVEDLKVEIVELKKEREDLEASFDGFKEESKTTEKSLHGELEKVKKEIQEAEDKSAKYEDEAKLAQREADFKIQEMMALSDMWKKENESEIEAKNAELMQMKKEIENLKENLDHNRQDQNVLLDMKLKLEDSVQNKDEEILSLKDKLDKQANEFNQLKTAIKSLTGSPKRQFFDEEALKTPSPSVYLPIFESNKDLSKMSDSGNTPTSGSPEGSTASERAIERSMKMSQKLSRQSQLSHVGHPGILKPTAIRQINQMKSVTFLSPVYHPPDSDSSEGFAVDIISDSEDRFESIRRSTNVRHCKPDVMKRIPKANIQPFPRDPPPQSSNQEQACGSTSKRPRYDKSSLKTYTSPRDKNK